MNALFTQTKTAADEKCLQVLQDLLVIAEMMQSVEDI